MLRTILLPLFALAHVSNAIPREPLGNCPDGWSNNTKSNSCYLYVNTFQASMTDADIYCQSFGGHLASIIDKEEQRFAQKLAEYGNFWIGLKQKDDSKGENLKDDFTWTDGSKTTDYSGFASGSGMFLILKFSSMGDPHQKIMERGGLDGKKSVCRYLSLFRK